MNRAHTSRRRFLASTAAATLALSIAPSAEPTRRLKAGFLGTAHSHFTEKFRIISTSAGWDLVGVCERDANLRARGPDNARWISETELLEKCEVVIVESPVADHAADARLALDAGRHVHVEKPPADSVAGLRDVLHLAANKKRLLQVGYMWRHHPGIQAVLEASRQGWLGDVYLVRAGINTTARPEQRAEWARFPGGMMFELGCHLLDPMIRLLGRPNKVTPTLQRTSPAADSLADNCLAVLEFSKALGVVSSAALQPNAHSQRFFEILGTNGTAKVQPLEPAVLTIDLAQPAGPYVKGRQEIKLPEYRRYLNEFEVLLRAIRSGEPLEVTAETELNVHEALMMACGAGR